MVDPNVPRAEVVRLAAGATPEKLARVVALLRPVELQMAVSKMRVRRTPSNQAHVCNRLDDPLLLAADAATAVAYGFREVETTVPVNADAASNALAVLIGSQVGAGGALTQCSIEEALELELGLRGLTTYAETVSLYGTEKVFIDGDDTPWSKAFLCSAYASRGLKMRVTSGGGAEALMGAAEGRSMFSLESRCVALARAMGAQGVQNGGIDGASVVGCVPDGMRELLAENLLVMLRDLESCSGNDALVSESDMRRTAHTVPLFLAGSDFIFSGFGAIQRYDNMFGPSNFNAEDLDDYLVLQRDWGVDGALRPVTEDGLRAVRERAARACLAVYRELGLAEFTDDHVAEVVVAAGSKDVTRPDPQAILAASGAIMERQLGILDVVRALWATGYEEEAGRVLAMGRARVAGDYLQTAAIFDEGMRCLSKITDPNDYQGPGTGYEAPTARREQIAAIRQERSRDDLLARHAAGRDAGGAGPAAGLRLDGGAAARPGADAREVCIGVSPAFATKLWFTMSGLPVGEALAQLVAGVEDEGCTARVVRVPSTVDLGVIGLTAAGLAGSGVGLGLQAKGTALIHRKGLAPLACLELLSIAPLLTPEMYRELGANAARYAKGERPSPVRNPYTDQAIEARYHAEVVALVAIERGESVPGAPPVELEVER
jgi:propanediol dehydratase large subunit